MSWQVTKVWGRCLCTNRCCRWIAQWCRKSFGICILNSSPLSHFACADLVRVLLLFLSSVTRSPCGKHFTSSTRYLRCMCIIYTGTSYWHSSPKSYSLFFLQVCAEQHSLSVSQEEQLFMSLAIPTWLEVLGNVVHPPWVWHCTAACLHAMSGACLHKAAFCLGQKWEDSFLI